MNIPDTMPNSDFESYMERERESRIRARAEIRKRAEDLISDIERKNAEYLRNMCGTKADLVALIAELDREDKEDA